MIAFAVVSYHGFAAHIDFKSSITGSILELVERDAFIRFWHDPLRAYNYSPDIMGLVRYRGLNLLITSPVGA